MSRSPLFYPLNRALDAEAGGLADLQTDVMRFMAILALCLVAIFALVQSIPLSPAPAAVIEEPLIEDPIPEPAPQPVEKEITLTRPELPKLQPRQEAVALQRPVVKPLPRREEPKNVEVPAPAPPATEPVKEGFTLRFEDDAALTRLVARTDIGLYAIARDRSYRMSINRARMEFWPASTPNQFHEMDSATVPNAVIDALRTRHGGGDASVTWGVTIPAAMSRQLNDYLRQHAGGALIIDAQGALRLEQ